MIFLKSLFNSHLTISIFRIHRNLRLIKALSDFLIIEFERLQVYYITLIRSKSHVNVTRQWPILVWAQHCFDELFQQPRILTSFKQLESSLKRNIIYAYSIHIIERLSLNKGAQLKNNDCDRESLAKIRVTLKAEIFPD